MRTRLTFIAVGMAAAMVLPSAGALATGPGTQAPTVSAAAFPADGFLSPDKKIWCQEGDGEVGCVALRYGSTPGHGAVAKRGGGVTLCTEKQGKNAAEWACFQNFDKTAPVLHYGKRAEAGGFRCTSARQGVICTVIATGKGFAIDKSEVLRIS
jgi:hypothetical protein